MRSMTAYAQASRKRDSQSSQVILRAINFKYLDINLHHLPVQNIILEEKIKKEIRKKIHRGKVEVFMFLKGPTESEVFINEKVVATYISKIKKISKKYKLKHDLGISDILHLPHATYWQEKKEKDESLIMPALNEALKNLVIFKERQGKQIKTEMGKNLRSLKTNIRKIKRNKPKVDQMENGKGDIDEEISLMSFYANTLEKKINSKGTAPMGKAIDFLTQEILRELNAASSKTKAKRVAVLIVEAKNYLERIREQAQNIE